MLGTVVSFLSGVPSIQIRGTTEPLQLEFDKEVKMRKFFLRENTEILVGHALGTSFQKNLISWISTILDHLLGFGMRQPVGLMEQTRQVFI